MKPSFTSWKIDPSGVVGWSLRIQYGVQNYLNVRPAEDAGDCGGLENAVGAVTGTTGSGGGDDDDERESDGEHGTGLLNRTCVL